MPLITRNELNQKIVTLTKAQGGVIMIPVHQIRLLEEVDISAWYQQANMGTQVSYMHLSTNVRESIIDIRNAIGWGN